MLLKTLRFLAEYVVGIRRHETIQTANETSFLDHDNIMKPRGLMVHLTKQAASSGPNRPNRQGTVMIKALSAVAIAAFMAAALTVLPGFAPTVEASTPVALAKADRLDIRSVGADCSQKAWPNFEASCLRAAGTKAMVKEARLVTAERR